MDWKREAVDKLRGYEARRQALENIPAELGRLEEAYTALRGAKLDGIPVSGGDSTREDFLLSNIVHREELGRQLTDARLWVEIVDRALSVLNEQDQVVLNRFYMSWVRGNVGRLCEELDVEKATVYRRRDQALRLFTLALYGGIEN